MSKKVIKVSISVTIETDKPFDEVDKAIRRGIYRGLDTEPNNIAPPSKVTIEEINQLN